MNLELDIQQLKIDALVEVMQDVIESGVEDGGERAIDKFLEAKKFIQTLEDSM
jgi:hypothetical protein